ncbi:HAD family hydrolase [Paenibacillus sp. SC116]|uniref:HAD family hydrolase n=1 Tax=Paenibacillus sp. SC116 TaxID=2968986 RepID=UPI00215A2A5A|nr:HAD family hydrolase [Paenibacillus sp. SC116]MCR8845636.1 HAD family hydrolase [Paenibacillus sp. SC116]
MTIKAIIFDLDETLTDRKAAIEDYINSLIFRYFPDSDKDMKLRIIDRFREADNNGYRDKSEVYRMLVQNLDWVNPPSEDEYLDFFREELPRCIKPMNNLHSVLNYFKSKGLLIGIITNGTVTVQNNKITNLGIREFFDTIIISEEVGIKKPHQEIFNIALNRLNIASSDAWYIGDNPDNDIIGATVSGIRSIWITRDGEWNEMYEHKPFKTINKLEDLINIYENL